VRDITIDQITDKVVAQLGLKISKPVARKLARELFKTTFRVMRSNRDRIVFRESDLLSVYRDYDRHKLCMELAEGKDVPTYDDFNKNRRLRPIHKKYIRTTIK